MPTLEPLFVISSMTHGKGSILYSWHPSSQFVASSGSSRVVNIFDRRGKLIEQIASPSNSQCVALEWDAEGKTLAILHGGACHEVLLWDFGTKDVVHVDLNVKEPTFMKWSKTGQQLAIGTGRGDVLMYDKETKQCWYADAKHKKKIICGDWNSDNKFAFASDDRQITITTMDGKTFGQVKVKSRPTSIKFGSTSGDRENTVSVSMDRKTILLYNLDDPENALELAFQQRYGYIVSFKWFRDGHIMVGFDNGFLVIISTHIAEIGREQFCARFHDDCPLRDIAYCPVRHKVATCGDNCLKIIDMRDWKEQHTQELYKGVIVDKVTWTNDGNILSYSTKNGFLYVFSVEPAALPLMLGAAGAVAGAAGGAGGGALGAAMMGGLPGVAGSSSLLLGGLGVGGHGLADLRGAAAAAAGLLGPFAPSSSSSSSSQWTYAVNVAAASSSSAAAVRTLASRPLSASSFWLSLFVSVALFVFLVARANRYPLRHILGLVFPGLTI